MHWIEGHVRVLGLVALGLVMSIPMSVTGSSGTPSAEEQEMGTSAGSGLIEEYVAALNDHDGEKAAAMYTEDAVVTQAIQNGSTFTGRQEIAGWVSDNVAGLPDLKVTVDRVVQDGDTIAWEWTYTGTYTGQFPGAPAGEGQDVTLRGSSVMDIADGLIASETLYFDNLSFLIQIGVTDMPATPVSGSD